MVLTGDGGLVENSILNMDLRDWGSSRTREAQENAVAALEQGRVLYFPALAFAVLPDETIPRGEVRFDPA